MSHSFRPYQQQNLPRHQQTGAEDLNSYAGEAAQGALNSAKIGLYVCDYHTGEILLCNEIYAKAQGRDNCGDMVGGFCYRNMGYEKRCPFCPYDKLLDEKGKPAAPYTWTNYFEKYDVWIQSTSRALYWTDGRLVQMVIYVNITRQQVEEEMNRRALLDRVTHIPNTQALERDLHLGRSYDCMVGLDIRSLGKINSAHGRQGGDALLLAVRDYIYQLQLPQCHLYSAEIGNFLLAFEPPFSAGQALRVARRLQSRFDKAWLIDLGAQKQNVFAGLSISVIPVSKAWLHPFDQAQKAIEHTLALARKTGDIAIYDEDMYAAISEAARLELSLKNAVRDQMQGFSLVFQPIVEHNFTVWRGLEALCRWHSPELGPIPPDIFVPLAESCGLIGIIGHWVLEEAIRQVKAWQLDVSPKFVLNVNLSPMQLAMANLDEYVMELLEKYQYPPEKLCLEITESGELNFSRHNLRAIECLARTGVIIALDDFGTGYSSFHNLHNLPVKLLKTSRSFIADVESDSRLRHLFYVMVELAHGADMKIIAEGVENEQQARIIFNQGADYFQGYYFSRPLSAAELEQQLGNFRRPAGPTPVTGYAQLDLTGLGYNNINYNLPPLLNKVLERCMRELFTNADNDAAINNALMLLGQSLDIGSCCIFMREGDDAFQLTHEWCAPQLQGNHHGLDSLSLAEHSQLAELLAKDGLLITPIITRLDPALSHVLQSMGIKAVVVVPVWREGELCGFVSFNDHKDRLDWSREEIGCIYTFTDIVTTILGKLQLKKEIISQKKVHDSILNSMDTAIHVTDIDTGRILFTNAALQKMYAGQDLRGRYCWEVLENRGQRCEFCPINWLKANPDSLYQWEHYCAPINKHLRVRSLLIPWGQNATAHLEYAEDITELRSYQDRLEILANTDMLTATLNRPALENRLRGLLRDSLSQPPLLTLAFVDLDCLKTANDNYGHSAGDEIIRLVVQTLRSVLGVEDFIGRYGGDEFIVVFPQSPRLIVEDKIRAAQGMLENILQARQRFATSGFSYGIAESREIAAPACASQEDNGDFMKAIIDLADQRMLEQKKEKKINLK